MLTPVHKRLPVLKRRQPHAEKSFIANISTGSVMNRRTRKKIQTGICC